MPVTQLTLIPIGLLPEDLLDWLVHQVQTATGLTITVGPNLPLPAGGNEPKRGQYRGETILSLLHGEDCTGLGQVIGIIDADCYMPGLNYIFGQAVIGGREGFVALPRLRESYYARSGNPNLFHQRVLKEVVHELGHTLGLNHCLDPRCVMHFSSTLVDTDYKSHTFCAGCRRLLNKRPA